ncbi:hypothetical protein ACFVYD_11905 [Streptomyces sp. NPDC058301]|uniref:hypothetical protein n=1 Tax=Streptomyces sp. NPDC058301 TaxID=3346436 RepID=UPI0036ECDA93
METGEALCCATAVRLGGALGVLAARAGLLDRYDQVMAGVEDVIAALDGHELDAATLGKAFGVNWTLGTRYPAELPGGDFFRTGMRIADVVLVATRPGQQAAPAQGLEYAAEAAAAWPTEVRAELEAGLADFELACQQEAEERLREGGPNALWELAAAQADQYRKVAELLFA